MREDCFLMEDWKAQVGQRLVGGFPGKTISPEFIRLVREYKIGNVILFEHNVESMEQIKRLCGEIQELVRSQTGHGAFITIDQEGGGVTRLPENGCNVPGAMATTAAGDPEYAEILASLTAKELKSLGVNFNLAPSMDVNNNPLNPVIGVRSYSDRAETVAEYGIRAVKGYRKENFLACAKHFPGHGDTAVDSHLGLPVIDKTLEELEQLELKPFRAVIEGGIEAVMSSHILFPRLEPDRIPCTMSKRIVTGILKERMGFRGLVLSDCMEMDAIQKYYGTAKGVAAAMAAGVDLVFVSNSQELLEESVLEVYRAVEEGRISPEEMRASAEKIIAYKKRYVENSVPEEGCSGKDREKEREIRRKSIVLTQGKLFPVGKDTFFTGCPGFRATLASSVDDRTVNFAEYLAKGFGARGLITSKDPDGAEISRVLSVLEGAESVVVSTYNGHLQPGQRKLVEALGEQGIPLLVVALRNPYDLADLPENATGIAAWDNSLETLELLTELLRGEWQPEGRMPVGLT